MLSPRKLELLLAQRINNETVLVHGTSVEAAVHLVKTGRLPGSDKRFTGYSHQGYLFFFPQKQVFRKHPLYSQITMELAGTELENEVEPYAKVKAYTGYFVDQLEFSSPNLAGLALDALSAPEIEDIFIDGELQGITRKKLLRVHSKAKERKGVIIGINSRIFKLDIVNGFDLPGEEVAVHLPHGLTSEYVQYIHPLGKIEDSILKEYYDKEKLST